MLFVYASSKYMVIGYSQRYVVYLPARHCAVVNARRKDLVIASLHVSRVEVVF